VSGNAFKGNAGGMHHSKAKKREEDETTLAINLEHKSLDILNSVDLFEVDACHYYAMDRAELEAGYFLFYRQFPMDTKKIVFERPIHPTRRGLLRIRE